MAWPIAIPVIEALASAVGATGVGAFLRNAYDGGLDYAAYKAKLAAENAAAEVKLAVGKGIRRTSEATSPRRTSTSDPNRDLTTGRPIMVSDLTNANVPIITMLVTPRVMRADNPPQEKPEGEPPVEGGSESGTANPSPNPENKPGDKKPDNESSKLSKYFWETKNNTQNTSRVGRYLRNFGVRLPAYLGVAAPGADVVGNVIGASGEPDNIKHEWIWPVTKGRFVLERGAYKLIKDAYKTKPDSTKLTTLQDANQSKNLGSNRTMPWDEYDEKYNIFFDNASN